jgi:hypothetical protein
MLPRWEQLPLGPDSGRSNGRIPCQRLREDHAAWRLMAYFRFRIGCRDSLPFLLLTCSNRDLFEKVSDQCEKQLN